MGTHTHANLEVSGVVYSEIADRLRAAGYSHVFGGDGTIDMHGIALVCHGGHAHTFPNQYQHRVNVWMMKCFSMEITRDRAERNHRLLEESLELVQSLGCTQIEAHLLVDYVFSRKAGEPVQELGGLMVTAAALASANDLDLAGAAEMELARIWQNIDTIRAKQAAKPKYSPLPE